MADELVRNVVSASRHGDKIFLVLMQYYEADAVNASGLILRCGAARQSKFETLINSNDNIGYLWTSPEGSIWACSGTGTVWTTAPVNWGDPQLDWLDYDVEVSDYTWKIMELPPLASGRGLPVLQLVWGTSDRDVHVPSFSGSIYHWTGDSWTERPSGVRSGFNDIHGDRADNVYAVGDAAGIAHFDGSRWRRVPAPEELSDAEVFTGVRVLADGDVLVCSRGGSILRGNVGGFELIAKYPVTFGGIAVFKDRIVLAASDGAWELVGRTARRFKEKLSLIGAMEAGDDMALFIEADQSPDPTLLDFTPAAEAPWWRRTFPRPS